VVSLSRDIDPANPDPLGSGIAVVQRFMGIGEFSHKMGKGVSRVDAVTDHVGISGHGSNTHLDGLAHYAWDGKNYNGFDFDESELVRTCAATGRWSFFFAMLPWRMVGVTSRVALLPSSDHHCEIADRNAEAFIAAAP
jgi:hypothetical protein